MVKVEIRTHKNNELIYSNNDQFKDVKLFFEEMITGESESSIMHKLVCWDQYNTYPDNPNLREEFTNKNIKRVFIHHKKWNTPRNYIFLDTYKYTIDFLLTDKQISTIEKCIEKLGIGKANIYEVEKNLKECGFSTEVDFENDMIFCGHPFFNRDNLNIKDGGELIDMIIKRQDCSYKGLDEDGFYVIKHHPFLKE